MVSLTGIEPVKVRGLNPDGVPFPINPQRREMVPAFGYDPKLVPYQRTVTANYYYAGIKWWRSDESSVLP